MKRPATAAVDGEDGGSEDGDDDDENDGDDEADAVMRRPAGNKLKSSPKALMYSKIYHQVRNAALAKGIGADVAKERARKAARKATANM